MRGKIRGPLRQQSVDERTTVQGTVISKFESPAMGMRALGQIDDNPAEDVLKPGDWTPAVLRSNPFRKGTTWEHQLL
jgi:hypothetical protein